MSRGSHRSLVPHAHSDLTKWPAPDVTVFERSIQDLFSQRRSAVEMYAYGQTYHQIKIDTGTGENETRRLVKRCVTPDGEGDIFGFYALIPGTRLKGYVRKADVLHNKGDGSGGCAGALGQLFERFPEIEDLVQDLYLKKSLLTTVHESRISILDLHECFIKKLRKLDVKDSQWPFNTTNLGYKALAEYCRKFRENHIQRGALSRSGKAAAGRSSVGNGYKSIIPNLRAFSFVQLDYHKVDAASIIVIHNDHGAELEIPVSRWHIGFLVEERYGAIVGAHVALERTPSGDSTLEVIESALRPEEFAPSDPRGAHLGDGKALLMQFLPELEYQCFSALKVDNAWSNAANDVVNNIIDTVGCAVNFGPTYAWWRRSLIEKIFGELTRRGLQRLPSTHGSGPTDTRTDDPNGQAIKFRILISELISIIYDCIREHNSESTERLQFSSPLQGIKAALSHPASGFFRQTLPLAVKNDLQLITHIEEVTVRGNINKNERPYFKTDRCRYTNRKLADAYWLIGKKLIIYVNRRKARIVHATVKDTGERLGLMVPEGKWANSECSWRDRKLINRSGMALTFGHEGADPVAVWKEKKSEELRAKPKSKKKKSSSVALDLARIAGKKNDIKKGTQPSAVAPIKLAPPQATCPDPFGLSDAPKMVPVTRRR